MKFYSDFNSVFNSQVNNEVPVFNHVQERAGVFDIVTSPSRNGSLVQVYYNDLESYGAADYIGLFSEKLNRDVYKLDFNRIVMTEPAVRGYSDLISDVVMRFCSGLGMSFECGKTFDDCFRSISRERGLTREEAKRLADEIDVALRNAGRIE